MKHDSFYEKSDSVLWAFKPNGILLHNFFAESYIELNGLEQVVWSYLDGVHTLQDIQRLLERTTAPNHSDKNDGAISLDGLAERVFRRLEAGKFIVPRRP